MAYPALMRCLWSSTPVIAGRVGEAVLYRCSGRGCGAKSGRSGHVSRTQDVNAAANGSGRCDSSEWSASERRKRHDDTAETAAGMEDAPCPKPRPLRNRRNRRSYRILPAAAPQIRGAPPATAPGGLQSPRNGRREPAGWTSRAQIRRLTLWRWLPIKATQPNQTFPNPEIA
jgi:hypothetical protein